MISNSDSNRYAGISQIFLEKLNGGNPLTVPEAITVVTFSIDGSIERTDQVVVSELDRDSIQYFSGKFQRLSGDLELPMEGKLPGDCGSIEFRICSDLNGAYVLYYEEDDALFSSLLLSGTNETSESELAQVFKFLLLDTSDDDDPTEEEIDAVLAASEFDFFLEDARPAIFQICLTDHPEDVESHRQVARMNLHLATAFFEAANRAANEPS